MPPIRPKAKPNAKVRIVGHGRATARPQVAARVRQSTLDRLDAAVEGPRYLAIDYVLALGLAQIEQQEGVTDIDAAELDESQQSPRSGNSPNSSN
jgi:hypothetical protein